MSKQTITITFGDQAENHVGMQKLGALASKGLSITQLHTIQEYFESLNYSLPTEYITLNTPDQPEAAVLVIRGGVSAFVTPFALHTELLGLKWDTKAKMYGRVVNKHARHNLCFGDTSQEPDYDSGKGRIVAFTNVPILAKIKEALEALINAKLVAEGNLYYDISKCGIGYHGDSERRIVIAARFGESMPLYFQWYLQGLSIGEPIIIDLHDGDLYFMSEKAVGTDWKRKIVPTLRHATGAAKFTQR